MEYVQLDHLNKFKPSATPLAKIYTNLSYESDKNARTTETHLLIIVVLCVVGGVVLSLRSSRVRDPTRWDNKKRGWWEDEIPRIILRLVDRYGQVGRTLVEYDSGRSDDRRLGLKTGKQ